MGNQKPPQCRNSSEIS